jgi:hypothetical protein
MKIYVLVYINIYSLIYFLCIIIMSQHSPIMDCTHSQTMAKPLKINFSIPFKHLFYKTLHCYSIFSPQMKVLPRSQNTHLYTLNKIKLKISLTSYISHDSPYDSTCTLICNMTFIMSPHP